MNAVGTTTPLQDEDLIRRYLQTECCESADELASRHVVNIHSLVRSMVLDDATAEDLTQEVFLRAFRGLKSFNGRAKFSTWLHRIAMNTVHSHLQRQGKSPVVFHSQPPEATSDTARPEQIAIGDEVEQEIEEALAGLAPALRAAIVLTCLQGKTPREAAEIEGCATATMYWRIHAARKQLKQNLGRHLT